MILSKFRKIKYEELPSKAQEAYNFQRGCAILAEYGFIANLLKYDWNGADFIAQHINGDWLKIQLKGRLTIDPKYAGKEIHIMFEDKKKNEWYLFPHDVLLNYYREMKPNSSKSTKGFSSAGLSREAQILLRPYLIS